MSLEMTLPEMTADEMLINFTRQCKHAGSQDGLGLNTFEMDQGPGQ